MCYSAKAQYRGSSDPEWGLALGSDYDAPVGNLAYSFKPAINYNFSVIRYSDNFSMNFTAGYHQYKPKQDTFYYALESTQVGLGPQYGTIAYGNFTVYSFYLGLNYHLTITDQFKAYCGVNLGAYMTHFIYHSSDLLEDDNEDLHEEDLYLAPKLGFTYMLNDNIGLGLEGKYNLFAPTGDKQYNDRVGTLYNSYSAGIRLTYNF
jgi:outer membrane protein W